MRCRSFYRMFPMFSIPNLMMYFLNLISSTKYSLQTYPFRKVGTTGNTPASYSNRFELYMLPVSSGAGGGSALDSAGGSSMCDTSRRGVHSASTASSAGSPRIRLPLAWMGHSSGARQLLRRRMSALLSKIKFGFCNVSLSPQHVLGT